MGSVLLRNRDGVFLDDALLRKRGGHWMGPSKVEWEDGGRSASPVDEMLKGFQEEMDNHIVKPVQKVIS